jgi:ATP-binding cassette, subfamily C, bacterial
LILDEATTALDPETEAKICQTLADISKDITMIAISHQRALIEIANRVYKMEGGRLQAVVL